MSGRLVYREVGARGAYPDWLRAMRKHSGAYVIREKGGGRVLYVGESHSGSLTKTVTRHFQGWRRKKQFFFGLFARSEHDPGLRYDRGAVEVAVCVTRASKAVERQNALIRKLKPRDNILGAVEEVPF